jgi:hypothetical protein
MHKMIFAFLLFWAFPLWAAPPTYVSLKAGFAKFVKVAQESNDFETQLAAWQQNVEAQAPDIYAGLFHTGAPGSEQSWRARAQKWFPFLLEHSDAILAQFDKFDREGWPTVKALAARYPEVDFSDVRVMAIPSLVNFNGKVMPVNGHLAAVFGMDFLEVVKENPTLIPGADLFEDTAVLVAHEFTHALHMKVSQFGTDATSLSLLEPIWVEGMAEVHSQMLVAGTDLTTVLMERNLAKRCNSTQVQAWAADFLKDQLSAGTDEQMELVYRKWFLLSDWASLGVARAGYCLGYHVVLNSLRDHSFNELLHMDRLSALGLTQQALANMSQIKTGVF